jgi:hypothetical protein
MNIHTKMVTTIEGFNNSLSTVKLEIERKINQEEVL